MSGIWAPACERVDALRRRAAGDWTVFGEADSARGGPDTRLRFLRAAIQIDLDPQEIGKIYPVESGLVGDARTVLRHSTNTCRAPPRSQNRWSGAPPI